MPATEPAITEWIAVATGIGALLAAVYFAYRQTSIMKRQADIQNAQLDLQERQTNITKLQADIARDQTTILERQADIAKEQADIARQQLVVIEKQEQDRSIEKHKANLNARIVERSSDRYLIITNEGPSDARDLQINIRIEAVSQRNQFFILTDGSSIAAGSELEFGPVPDFDNLVSIEFEILWVDDSVPIGSINDSVPSDEPVFYLFKLFSEKPRRRMVTRFSGREYGLMI